MTPSGLRAAAFACVALLIPTALAHSTQRNPITYVSLLEEPILQTSSCHVHAYSSFDLTFVLHEGKQKVRLSLEPNHDIIHDTLQITYLRADGTVRAIEPVERTDHKVFKGHALVQHAGHREWTNAGWARITVHRDGKKPIFEGVFRLDGDHHHIQTGTNYRNLKHEDDPTIDMPGTPADEFMVVWRDSDIVQHYNTRDELKRDIYGRSSCSADSLDYNAVYHPLETRDVSSLRSVSPGQLFGRAIDGTTGNNGAGVNLVENIGSTEGCFNTRKVALIGVATDCTYTSDFKDEQQVRTNIIQQVNSASQVYESTFNISLGIQNLTISEKDCPATASDAAPWNVGCGGGVTIVDRLNLFSAWRGRSPDRNAYWTLLSKCNTDSAVGLAWLGQVCVEGAQSAQSNGGGNETIASANVVIRTPTEWQVFAHETGHTFGAVHDCTDASCGEKQDTAQKCCRLSSQRCDAGGQFIMNPSTGSGIKAFSPCSIGNICSAIGRSAVRTQCLTNNKDVTTITGSQCGNGIVETGEDCDCGGEQGCGDNNCCDAKTCKFKANAVCDPSNEDCCTGTCQFAAADVICRPSTGFCDPEEKCSGTSPMCPSDVHKDDGTSCGNNGQGLTCASGQCTSRDLQCRTMMGTITSGNDTYACNSQGCLLACASPQFPTGQCVTMNQNFLDGTPCQGGGKCGNGVCQGASITNEIGAWLSDNKKVVIPVASVVGSIIVIALVGCLVGSIRRRMARKKRKNQPKQQSMSSWQNYGGSFNPQGNTMAVPPPPAVASRDQRGRSRSQPRIPRAPPPEFMPYQPQWSGQGRSMRYA